MVHWSYLHLERFRLVLCSFIRQASTALHRLVGVTNDVEKVPGAK